MSRFGFFGALKIIIVLFWGLMVVFLVHRIHVAPEISLEGLPALADTETWMSVYFKGQKVGYSKQVINKIPEGYAIEQSGYMRLNLMGRAQELRTLTAARMTEQMALRDFNFFMTAGPVQYQITGVLDGLTLDLTTVTGGKTTPYTLVLEEAPRLASGLMTYLTQIGLKKGQRFKVPVFDPATLSTRPVMVVVEDTETMEVDGLETGVFRIRTEYLDTQTYTWVDQQGRVLKEEGLLGMRMVRTTEAEAQEGIAGRADITDMVEAASAPSSRSLKDPRHITYLRARLKGLDLEGLELDGGRQKLTGDVLEVFQEEIDASNEVRLPITDPRFQKYLKDTPFIQVKNENIKKQAGRIAQGDTSPLSVMEKVSDWVFRTLEKRPTMSVPSAVDVLESKTGDCNEHSVLAVALLRAAGVPARMAVGVLYFKNRFYYHAWVEAYYGRWIAIDPLTGQVPADATHIRFMTGGIEKQTAMIRVVGKLEVDILETRQRTIEEP